MIEDVRFIKQNDGSYKLIVTMPEEKCLQLNQILLSLNISFQDLIDGLFNEIIRIKKIPFIY